MRYFVSNKIANLRLKHACYGLLLCCLPVISPNAAAAVQTVLQDIKLSAFEDRTLIDIEFGLPLLYVKHFPQKKGEILQIQLKLGEDNDRRIHKEVRQAGDLKVPAGLESFLIYVTYEEGVPGGPYLTLRFAESVEFEVQAGSSLQSLTIIVKPEKKPAVAQDKAGAEDGSKRARQQLSRPGTVADDQVDEMMAKARQTLTFGDNKGAIELLRKIIRIPGNKHQQDARELLGLALERSNQIPRAKFEYKKYLRLYSKGDGAERVRQRLTALENLGIKRKKKLRRTRRERKDDKFKVFGRWTQSYSSFYVQSQPDNDQLADPGDFVASRIVSSNLNLRGRYRGSKRNVQTLLALNHNFDLLDRDKTDSRISYLNVDYDDFSQGLTAVAGRQRVRNGGVFGRFDGLIAGYRLSESVKPNFFLGKPVSFFDSDLYDKNFWGTMWELGKAKAVLNGNAYFVHQRVDKIHDRRAIGGVVRYSQKDITVFGLLDYDIEFRELITSNLRWGWQVAPKVKINLSYNERSDLTTSKAVFSVNVTDPVTTTSEQKIFDIKKYEQAGFSTEDIMEVARAKASRTNNFTLGTTYQVDKDKQVNFDVSVFSSSGSVGIINNARLSTIIDNSTLTTNEKDSLKAVEGTQGTGDQRLYSLQWISSNTFVERDLHVVGFRISDYQTYDEFGVYVNSRLPPIRNWNPRPRLSYSRRVFDSNNEKSISNATKGNLQSFKVSLKVDYRWKKAWIFDLDLGFEYQDYSEVENQDGFRESLRLSYHYTF